MKQVIFTLFVAFLATSIFAQAPQSFNYQGVARDLSGIPIVNQTIGLRIAILQGATSGDEIYKETHSTVTSDIGLFNLKIGTGDVTNGIFNNIDWGSDSHFLQIEIDENGEKRYGY